MTTTYTPTRPIMTAAELREHHVRDYGRDYTRSDDGYGDMDVNASRGWAARSSWGRSGWDLGDWPFVVLSTRVHEGRFEVLSVCEGDHSVYSFETEADRDAALDYLFLWYGASKSIDGFPVTWETREALDAGEITVDDRWRGPFTWARCDAERD